MVSSSSVACYSRWRQSVRWIVPAFATSPWAYVWAYLTSSSHHSKLLPRLLDMVHLTCAKLKGHDDSFQKCERERDTLDKIICRSDRHASLKFCAHINYSTLSKIDQGRRASCLCNLENCCPLPTYTTLHGLSHYFSACHTNTKSHDHIHTTANEWQENGTYSKAARERLLWWWCPSILFKFHVSLTRGSTWRIVLCHLSSGCKWRM